VRSDPPAEAGWPSGMTMSIESIPDPTPVLELLDAFRCSKVLFAAVALGIFDRLEEGDASLIELANSASADPDALERLLDACVYLKLLTRNGTKYANTPAASAYLCARSPRRIAGYLNYSNAVLWKMWEHLEDAVREGTHRWPQTFGLDGPIFSHFFRNEADKREFLLGMHGQGQISSPEVVNAFDLSRFKRLVDLGGATGHLAVAACRRYPQLRAVVFDLPAAVPLAKEMIGESEVAERIEVAEGDFFVDPLPEADLFAVGRILHDWSEAKIKQLLGKIHQRLPTGGALLVCEKLLNDDKSGPRWAVLQSLNMLVCTEGKERSLAEYDGLLKGAGFSTVEGHRTKSPLDAVLAVK
jgi:acetylserotonin N-methyltransferase